MAEEKQNILERLEEKIDDLVQNPRNRISIRN